MRTECHSEGQFFAVRGRGCHHYTRLQKDEALIFILSAQLSKANSSLMCYRCEGKEVRINVNVLRQLMVYALRVAFAVCSCIIVLKEMYFIWTISVSVYLFYLLFLDELLLCSDFFFIWKENRWFMLITKTHSPPEKRNIFTHHKTVKKNSRLWDCCFLAC